MIMVIIKITKLIEILHLLEGKKNMAALISEKENIYPC